jgi:hypothetical protein
MTVTLHHVHVLQAADPAKVTALGETFPLGPLDALVSTAVPIAVCFVYSVQLDSTKLRRAAKRLLDYYPQLTGRLAVDAGGAPSIHRLGSGAELHLASCDEPIANARDQDGRVDLGRLPGGGNDLSAPFDPARYDIDPLLTIKYTSFPDGAVLGVRCHHMVCDGTGYFAMVGHLAELYSTSSAPAEIKIPPIIQTYRPSITPGDYTPSTYSLSTGPVVLPGTPVQQAPVVGRFIHLDGAYLYRLKERATPTGGRTSTFTAIIAHLFHTTHRARRILYNKDALTPADLLISVGLRNKSAHLSQNYFSNALLTPNATYDSDALFDADLRDVAAFTNTIIRDIVKVNEIDDTVAWLHAQPDKSQNNSGFRFGNGAFMAAQWSGFDLYYLATFDGVRPVLAAPPFTPISLCDGLAYTLPPVPREDGKEDGLLVCIALSGPLWEVIDARRLLEYDNIGMALSVKEHAKQD